MKPYTIWQNLDPDLFGVGSIRKQAGVCLLVLYLEYFVAVEIKFNDMLDFLSGSSDLFYGQVMVQKVYDGSEEFAHIRLKIIGSRQQFWWAVAEIGGDHPVKHTLLIRLVKCGKTVRENTKCSTDKYAFGFHCFELPGGVDHAVSRGDHIVNDNDVFALNIISQKLMGDNRIFAVNDLCIVPPLVEHTSVGADDRGKVDRPVQGSLIGRDHDDMILVQHQVLFRAQECPCELVVRSKIVKTA